MDIFNSTLLEALPPAARAKAIFLDSERQAALSILRDADEALQDAYRRRSAAEAAAKMSLERFPDQRVSPEDRARLFGPAERISIEIDRLKDRQERARKRWDEHSFLPRVADFLKEARAAKVRLKDAPPVNVKGGADASRRIEEIRRSLDEIEIELARVSEAPRPVSELKRDLLAEIDRLAEQGSPSIDHRIRDGSPVKLAQAAALSIAGTSLIGDVGSFVVWAARDAIREKCLELIGDTDLPGALTDDQREARFDELATRRLALEREEEALISRASENGLHVTRRDDASPLAILGIVTVEEA